MEREAIFLHLNSANADYVLNNNTASVGFNLPLIETNIQMQILLSIEHIVIPYSYYNINQYNNILNYSINNVGYSLSISVGNYTAKDLRQYLTNNMPNFIITYDKIKNKYTFTHSSSDFIFLSNSTCFKLLGFDKKNNNSFSRTITSSNTINMIYTPCICIYSNIDSDCINKSASLQNKRLFHSIPIDVNPNGVIVHSQPNLRLNTYTNVLSYLEFQLCSIDGVVLDLNNNNWSITLRLDFLDFVN